MAFRRVELFGSAASIDALNRAINEAWKDSGDNLSVGLSPSGVEPATYFGGSGTIEDWRIAELPAVLARFPGSYAFLAEGMGTPVDEAMGMPFDSKLRSLSGFWQCSEYLGLRRIPHPDKLGFTNQEPVLLLQSTVSFHGAVADGQLIRCLSIPWEAIVKEIERNPTFLPQFSTQHRRFEEFLAASYERAGFEVTLTPQRGDRGRDVIATLRGLITVRILDQAKAYKPGHLVTHDDVRAMLGTLSTDSNASKGVVTTTSDFQPGILSGDEFQRFMPNRLELKNGAQLTKWLSDIKNSTPPRQ